MEAKMKLSLCSVIIGTILVMMSAIGQVEAGTEYLSERLVSKQLENGFTEEPVYLLKFDAPAEQPLVLNNLPAKSALLFAANYYALHARDFQVTPGEIIAAGFWPFQTIPVELMDSPLLVNELVYFHAEQLATIDTPGWVVNAKADILDHFYMDYYAQMPRGKHEMLPPAELTAIPDFWVNDLTGTPMRETADEGGTTLWDLQDAFGEYAGISVRKNTVDPLDPGFDWSVYRINRTNEGQIVRPVRLLTPENAEQVTVSK
jgi:hypothetical protein